MCYKICSRWQQGLLPRFIDVSLTKSKEIGLGLKIIQCFLIPQQVVDEKSTRSDI